MAGLEWCPCCKLQPATRTPLKSNRTKISNIQLTENETTDVVNSISKSQDPDDGYINLLTPNVNYSGRTAPLTSERSILYIYSTNIGTEYFKHDIYSPLFLFKMQFVS